MTEGKGDDEQGSDERSETEGMPVALPIWSTVVRSMAVEAPAVPAVLDGRHASEDLRSLMRQRDDCLVQMQAARDAVAAWAREYETVCQQIEERCSHRWVRTRTAMYEKEYRCTICQSDRIV